MGRGFLGWDPHPTQLPLSLEMSTLKAIKSRVSGGEVVPLFPFLAARDPTGWG